MSRRSAASLAAWLVLAASSCVGEARGERSTEEPLDRSLPMAVLIARFNDDQPAVGGFEGGSESKEVLVAEFMRAVERADSTTLRQLAVTRAEYGQLYFPTSRYASPPYELPPEVAYMLSTAASDKGLFRILRRLGGRPLRYSGHSCADSAAEGENTFWRECTVAYEQPGEGRVQRRLFRAIIERNGRYKILSYASDF